MVNWAGTSKQYRCTKFYFFCYLWCCYYLVVWHFTLFYFCCRNESIQQSANILYLSEYDHTNDESKLSNFIFLNNHYRQKLFLIFVYGDDYPLVKTRRNFLQIFVGARIFIILIGLAMVFFLFLIRHGDMTRKDTFISVYMDIIIGITNGSNLRYENHLEKIFFSILLFGAFFINTIALDNFLFYTFLTEEPNRMNSLEKYIEFNPPTFELNLPAEWHR